MGVAGGVHYLLLAADAGAELGDGLGFHFGLGAEAGDGLVGAALEGGGSLAGYCAGEGAGG